MTWSCLKTPLLEAWGAGGCAVPSRGSRTGEDREEPSWSAVPASFYSALSSPCGQGPWGKPAVRPGAQGRPRWGLWLAGLMCQADHMGSRSGPPGGEVETQMCRVGRTGSEGGGGRRDPPGPRSQRPRQTLPCCIQSLPRPGWVASAQDASASSAEGTQARAPVPSGWAQFPGSPCVWPRAVMKPPPVKGVTDARPGVTGCWRGSLTGAPLGLEFPLLLWLRGQCPGLSPPQGVDSPPPLGAPWRGSCRMGSMPVTGAEWPPLDSAARCCWQIARVRLHPRVCLCVRACMYVCVCMHVVHTYVCACMCMCVCVCVCSTLPPCGCTDLKKPPGLLCTLTP